MDPLTIGAVISAGVGLISSLFNTGSQSNAASKNLQATRETNALNKEIYEDNKKYNTPQAQMQRLQEAGINPNLAYTNGSVSNTASSAPMMQTPQYQAPQLDLSGVVQIVSNLAMAKAQIQNLNADTEKKRAEGNLAQSRATGQDNTNRLFTDTYENALKLSGISVEEAQQRRDKLASDISLNASRANEIQAHIDKLASSIAVDRSNIALNAARLQDYFSQIGLRDKFISRNLAAQTALALAKTKLTSEEIKKVAGQATLVALDITNYGVSLQNKILSNYEKLLNMSINSFNATYPSGSALYGIYGMSRGLKKDILHDIFGIDEDSSLPAIQFDRLLKDYGIEDPTQ